MPPSRWYLTGFLVPSEAPETQRVDPTEDEALAVDGETGGTDDDAAPEPVAARRAHFPSSMGLSLLVPGESGSLSVVVEWGDYEVTSVESASAAFRPAGEPDDEARPKRELWQRLPRTSKVTVTLGKRKDETPVPGSRGLFLVVTTRTVASDRMALVPPGTRAVSIFLLNRRAPNPDDRADESFAFQVTLTVRSELGFVARPNLRGFGGREWDDQIADLQYRGLAEYGVGHGVATRAVHDPDGKCRAVSTAWMPTGQVERVEPANVTGVELRMEALAEAKDAAELGAMLRPLVTEYATWLEAQAATPLDEARQKVAAELLHRASALKSRIGTGIDTLTTDPLAFEAFRIANRAMARQQRQRLGDFDGTGRAPTWRPFQLAFQLLNFRGVADPTHPDRDIVDLLFFPTGGGKTEAYLGLAAFVIVLRRLRHPGLSSAGVTVLMRYTLRLLTLDQLSRAATLICALELEREIDIEKLGPWPFEIGLWVGQAATPNRMGRKGDNDRYSARQRTIDLKTGENKPLPIPLENCPWCGSKFTKDSFLLLARGKPNGEHPTDLRVQCVNRACDFSARKNRPLPIVAVDEPIYRRLPCFLIATIDKFAGLPWVGQSGALFGRVDRTDQDGFYGAADPGVGRPLEKALLPPELIIQDELHLISGPLGSMAGLYETAVDTLCSRVEGTKTIRPKVVASTATVRRAEQQIHALFARSEVDIFPPPGPDLRDSFFAKTVPASDPDAPAPGTKNARLYLGIAAQGRSAKVILLRIYLAALGAAQKAYEAAGGARNPNNPADPYMTLLGYFNSLRELGGSRRIVEDEVRARLAGYGSRRRYQEKSGSFSDRKIDFDVLELTSRETTARVADSKRRLALSFKEDERVNVALATNMISVGLDITRLGLMVVLGQPKGTSEYIQATSRVGRDDLRPGLVVTILNVHRPRDRSHYERFESYHQSFYRAVEASSVTPFAARAIDRGLAGVTVALARHGLPELTAASRAIQAETARPRLNFVVDAFVNRAAAHGLAPTEADAVRAKVRIRVENLLDEWARIAHDHAKVTAGLQYQREEGGAPPLLRDPLDPELSKLTLGQRKFRANRSLRDVEPNINLWVKTIDGSEVEDEEVAP